MSEQTVITIAGKARHGKDTFAEFLQEELNINEVIRSQLEKA